MVDRPSDIPPGWDYNPSDWGQRLWIIVFAILGFFIAGYLALWQYDVLEDVFEPFFGDGTIRILSSPLSFPLENYLGLDLPIRISDAALGAFAYLLDAVFGAIGGPNRWRRMPWVVILFAILVGPLGLVSVGLVIAQPVMYGHWCTLCLVTAAISILMIGPAMDEAIASLQYMRRVIDRGNQSAWRVFLGLADQSRIIPPDRAPTAHPRRKRYLPSWNIPLHQMAVWSQGVAMAAGMALMIAPALLPYTGAADDNARIVGPFVATFGCIAMWEATRALRWVNLPLGAWLVIAPAVLTHTLEAGVVSVALGLVITAASLFRGAVRHRFAGGWRVLMRPDPYNVGPDAVGGPTIPQHD